MAIQVQVIKDSILISFIENDDPDGFREYLDSDDTLIFHDPEIFATEEEAFAFCAGLGYGADDHNPVPRYPLRSDEPADAPYLEAIGNY